MRIPLRIRHVHHDWLTRAAPGARCRFARKNAICAAHQLSVQNDIRGAQTHVFEGLRPSARRGGVTHLQRRQHDTAGLRQPLLVVKTAATREMRIPLRIRHVHHGWLTPAAPGAPCRFARKNAICAAHQLSAKNAIRGAQTHVFEERRPSARRGDVTHLQRRQHDTAGSRQPLLVHNVSPAGE